MDYQAIQKRVAETGLICRGGFQVTPDDGLAEGVRTLILIGDLGGQFLPRFMAERRDEHDPLDNWTRRVLAPVSDDLGAQVLYPFDQPHHPFQSWAKRAEGLKAAPIGPLIHPTHGPWHSYRGALAFDGTIDGLPRPLTDHPCDTCVEKPCLTTCPVHAFSSGDFDLGACLGHLKSTDGVPCMTGGCLARRACPIGADHIYGADHQAFLAHWFVAAFGD